MQLDLVGEGWDWFYAPGGWGAGSQAQGMLSGEAEKAGGRLKGSG